MSEVKRYYIGAYSGEAEARTCSPNELEIIHQDEARYFVLDEDFDRVTAERDGLQTLLTSADERDDQRKELLRTSLIAMKRIYQAGYDRIIDAGGTCDTPEYMMDGDPTVREIRAALKPAEGGGDA